MKIVTTTSVIQTPIQGYQFHEGQRNMTVQN